MKEKHIPQQLTKAEIKIAKKMLKELEAIFKTIDAMKYTVNRTKQTILQLLKKPSLRRKN